MIPFHPIANLFPLIEGKEFAELVDDVRAHGLMDLIVVWDGQILDGRNRYRAGIEAGIFDADADFAATVNSYPTSVHFERFEDLKADGADPLTWVLSHNLHRRHLNESQRAMIAAKLSQMKVGRPPEWNKTPERANSSNLSHSGGDLREADAAEQLSVSRSSLQTAKRVLRHGAPELVDKVASGEIAVSAADMIASLPREEQIEAIRSADPKALAAVVRERRREQQDDKREQRDERAASLALKHRAIPSGLNAGIIVADPAWKDEEVWSDDTGMDRAADNHYPTMTLREVMDLDVGSVAAPNAVLFMYCKANNLVEAICVAMSWGFAVLQPDELGRLVPDRSGARYASQIVWDKQIIGNGRWVRDRHEILLIFRRGKPVCPAPGTQLDSVWSEKKTEHSAKPEGILDWIDRIWPDEVKIELNRRGAARPGWTAWGNEAEPAPAPVAAEPEAAAGSDDAPAAEPAKFKSTAKSDAIITKGYRRKVVDFVALGETLKLALGLDAAPTKLQIRRRANQLGLGDRSRQQRAVAVSNKKRGRTEAHAHA